MRRTLFVLVLFMVVFATGCGNSARLSDDKINVMTSFYPLYDFAVQIGGEHVNVVNVIPAGIDPHDWSPKSQDIVNTSRSQLFIYNGAGFDDWWVENMLNSVSGGDRPHVVVASEGIELIPARAEDHAHDEEHGHAHADAHEEEHDHAHTDTHDEEHGHAHADANEGDHGHVHEDAHEEEHGHAHEDAHAGHDHDHGHVHEDAHEEEHGHAHEDAHAGHDHDHGDYDPHVWLSLENAIHMANRIKDGLITVDPEHAAEYEANYEKLKSELEQLHEEYRTVTQNAPRKEFVTSHRAFAYMARDYGLTQLSVMGLSTEAEPTSQDIKAISDFIKENDVKYIMFEELASPKIAQTLARDLGIEILTLNPLEGLTREQEAAGENYISLMRHNLRSLELALQE